MSAQSEALSDKQIRLVGCTGIIDGELLAHFSEDEYTVRITYGTRSFERVASNLFDALAEVHTDLERDGLRPAVEGACKNVYPSRMAREMGGGRRAYKWSAGSRPATVDIFDEVPTEEYGRLAYVDEQLAWIKERQGQRNA